MAVINLPTISSEQRKAALAKAAEVRVKRKKIKESIIEKKVTVADVVKHYDEIKNNSDKEADKKLYGGFTVWSLVTSTPGIGKVSATDILIASKIPEKRLKTIKVRGIGSRQKTKLLEHFQ